MRQRPLIQALYAESGRVFFSLAWSFGKQEFGRHKAKIISADTTKARFCYLDIEQCV